MAGVNKVILVGNLGKESKAFREWQRSSQSYPSHYRSV